MYETNKWETNRQTPSLFTSEYERPKRINPNPNENFIIENSNENEKYSKESQKPIYDFDEKNSKDEFSEVDLSDRETPEIFRAIKSSNTQFLDVLLERGVDSNLIFNGQSPLHFSSTLNNFEYVQMLIHYNSDPYLLTNSGYSPYHLSNSVFVKNILRNHTHGIFPKYVPTKILNENVTREEVIEWISNLKSRKPEDLNNYEVQKLFSICLNGNYFNEIQSLFCSGFDVSFRYDQFKNTLLHYAVAESNYQLVKLLLSTFHNPDVHDLEYAQTPLDLAIISGNLRMFTLLLLYGANQDDYECIQSEFENIEPCLQELLPILKNKKIILDETAKTIIEKIDILYYWIDINTEIITGYSLDFFETIHTGFYKEKTPVLIHFQAGELFLKTHLFLSEITKLTIFNQNPNFAEFLGYFIDICEGNNHRLSVVYRSYPNHKMISDLIQESQEEKNEIPLKLIIKICQGIVNGFDFVEKNLDGPFLGFSSSRILLDHENNPKIAILDDVLVSLRPGNISGKNSTQKSLPAHVAKFFSIILWELLTCNFNQDSGNELEFFEYLKTVLDRHQDNIVIGKLAEIAQKCYYSDSDFKIISILPDLEELEKTIQVQGDNFGYFSNEKKPDILNTKTHLQNSFEVALSHFLKEIKNMNPNEINLKVSEFIQICSVLFSLTRLPEITQFQETLILKFGWNKEEYKFNNEVSLKNLEDLVCEILEENQKKRK
eukprot:Anaeramoba_ignava/c19823_g1_i2.p1 GENE.c19823_g1_i2~~c19823_g1_i2.p1  ORF type:complete len:718 (+),score=263.98 c19823_g1_i2:208-2361(+)